SPTIKSAAESPVRDPTQTDMRSAPTRAAGTGCPSTSRLRSPSLASLRAIHRPRVLPVGLAVLEVDRVERDHQLVPRHHALLDQQPRERAHVEREDAEVLLERADVALRVVLVDVGALERVLRRVDVRALPPLVVEQVIEQAH